MKKMNKKLHWTLTLLLVSGFMISYAQENQPDTIHLTTEKIVGDKRVVWDTIIIVTSENKDAVHEYMQKKHKGIHIITDHKDGSKVHSKTGSLSGKKLKVHVDADVKVDGKTMVFTYTTKGGKLHKGDRRIKIIKEKLHRVGEGEHELSVFVEADESGDYEVIWMVDSTLKDKMVNVWMSKDGKDKKYEFVVLDGKEGHFDIHELKDSMKNVMVEYIHKDGEINEELKKFSFAFISDDENSFTLDSLHEHLNMVKELKFTSKGDAKVHMYHYGDVSKEIKVLIDGDLKDLKEDMIFISSDKNHNKMHFGKKHEETVDIELSIDVSDEEIAELGIKTKANELKVENFWMFYSNENELELKFTLDTKGKTTIKVLDASGKAIFSDKVVYFPGTYDKKIDLGDNHTSPLYIYVVQGNASTIKKLSVH